MDRLPSHVIAVFDEAYYEFLDDAPDTLKYVREGRNVCILRTCSKIHGLAALRVGYGLAPKSVADILQKARQPFNVNAIAQAGALAALTNFILVKVGDGDGLFKKMLQRGIILRAMSSYKLPEWVRISVGTMAQNRRCIEVMDEVLRG